MRTCSNHPPGSTAKKKKGKRKKPLFTPAGGDPVTGSLDGDHAPFVEHGLLKTSPDMQPR